MLPEENYLKKDTGQPGRFLTPPMHMLMFDVIPDRNVLRKTALRDSLPG